MKQHDWSENNLVSAIKEKRELRGVADIVVRQALQDYTIKHRIKFSLLSSSEAKELIKIIRAQLRRLTGQYQKSVKSREKMFQMKDIQKILESHSSTAERISFYPALKKIISNLKPLSILDVGCGLNPLAITTPKIEYYACDINEGELSIVHEFFKKKKIIGKTFVCDIRNPDTKFPAADVCLIFKVLDLLDKKKYILTENILKKISCKHFLISFSSKKLSGKRMNFPERRWFEAILEKNNFEYKKIYFENEIFYLISTSEQSRKVSRQLISETPKSSK